MSDGLTRLTPADSEARLQRVLTEPGTTLVEALARLEAAATGVLLLADAERRLLGVLTDGDIRRAILAGATLDSPCLAAAQRAPLVAPAHASPAEALELMDRGREFTVHHLPLVDADGRVTELVLRSDLTTTDAPDVCAVIMAGGFGTRLRPLTDRTPKPMLPVDGRPLLELTIERLREAGIRHINVTTHHLGERITDHFGDGHAFGVELSYVAEEHPLGTAGSLKRVKDAHGTLLVINGDVLTDLRFQAMLAFHRQHGADATIGVRRYELQVPYGVVDGDGAEVRAIREKPSMTFLINAGVYLLAPDVQHYIPEGERFDMTDLFACLLAAGRRVVSFPIVEYWCDIGQHADLDRARREYHRARV